MRPWRHRHGGGAGTATAPACWASSSPRDRTSTTYPDARRLPDRVEQAARPPRAELPETTASGGCAEQLGGNADDWSRLGEAWGGDLRAFLGEVGTRELEPAHPHARRQQVGYGRVTRRWWSPILACAARTGPARPRRLLRLLEHALARQPPDRHGARARGRDRRLASSTTVPHDLHDELEQLRDGARGLVGQPPLLRARGCSSARTRRRAAWTSGARARSAARRPALPLAPRCASSARSSTSRRLDPAALDPRLGPTSTPSASPPADAVIVNIEYPLGLAAYNILREIAEAIDRCAASTCSARRRR